jgi:DNA (cytosine-5)-methyltransferase 1
LHPFTEPNTQKKYLNLSLALPYLNLNAKVRVEMVDMDKIKILNLYAGIGGNRKLWGDEYEITSVEWKQEIADIYHHFFPKDKMIVGDAHQYLLYHFKEYDFIWSSPPCPSHSRMRNLLMEKETIKPVYPSMQLYEEIIFLKHWFGGKFVVENVISYYEPLIVPQQSNNHYFWANFIIPNEDKDLRGIRTEDIKYKEKRNGFELDGLNITNTLKEKVLNNAVKPEIGLNILNAAFKQKQEKLFSGDFPC